MRKRNKDRGIRELDVTKERAKTNIERVDKDSYKGEDEESVGGREKDEEGKKEEDEEYWV